MAAVKAISATLLLCLALVAVGCGDDDDSSPTTPGSDESSSARSPAEAAKGSKPKVTVPTGSPPQELIEEDLIEGGGTSAKAGDRVTVQYVGVGFDSRKEFDASWDRGEPFSFQLGAAEVIRGWDQGIQGMKAGGQRQLVIPAGLAYGETGFPPTIKPNEALVFVVDLLAVE
jgi:peptidylprolyl isomerase